MERNSLQSAKYSFVSGMTLALGKPLLMLAHHPFQPPFDYQDLLQVHKTAKECTHYIDLWLPTIEEKQREDRQRYQDIISGTRASLDLQRIYLGEHIAENEQRDLIEYFIPTAQYQDALNSSQSKIFIGRKGSGKTANLIMLEEEIRRDPRNHVCVIKPADYEISGILGLLRTGLTDAEQGFLIESLWKYLIYTELAISIYMQLKNRPIHYRFNDDENKLMSYIEEKMELIDPDFTIRLENAINQLRQANSFDTISKQRMKVSEILHSNILADLRNLLGRVLEKKRRVSILIDNLDKAWKRNEDLEILSHFLLGLFHISNIIPVDFQRSGAEWRPVNLSMVIFIRSDIFSYILSRTSEADKLLFTRIDWHDPILLQRVIEERFVNSMQHTLSHKDVWNKFFVQSIGEISTRDYILQKIVPRPRDILYFCKAALGHAINHNHIFIEEGDILQAERDYSQQAYLTLLAETESHITDVETILIEFAGSTAIVNRNQIDDYLAKAGVDKDMTGEIIELLCDSMFLGVETQPNYFEYIYDENKRAVFRSLARSFATRMGAERYKIALPFHSYLEIVN